MPTRLSCPSRVAARAPLPALCRLLLVLFLLAVAPSGRAEEDTWLGGPPPGERPVEILTGVNLINITDVNEREETIDFDAAVYMEWTDERLAYDPASVGMDDWTPGDYSRPPRKIFLGDFAVKEIFAGWRPHLLIANGIGNRVPNNMAVSIWPDGHIAYSESFSATAETPMDLRRYPFDYQQLEIYFHPFIYDRDEVLLVPNERLARTWDENVGIADWSRERVSIAERAGRIAYFDDRLKDVSEFTLTIEIQRRPYHFLVSILAPMVLLVSLTWSVFWMDRESLSTRVDITFIGILSVVAYYFVILDRIPEVPYLTLVDTFMIATFLMLTAGVVLIVVVETLGRSRNYALVGEVDRICRWAFPLGYVVLAGTLATAFLLL